MRRLAVLLLGLCMALPVLAADAAKAQRKEVFGDVTVHYSAFTSSMLQPAIATANGLIRSKNQGVLTVSVLKGGKPDMAMVSGSVKDLTGRSSPLAFRHVGDPSGVSYLAQFPIEHAQTLIFELTVASGGASHSFSFNQEVFPGE